MSDTTYEPLQRVRDSFAQQSFMRLLGVEVVEVSRGRCLVAIAADKRLLQQQGFVHGAVLGAIADVAGGYATLSQTPETHEVLTVEYKINFLAPARGGRRLYAEALVVGGGRRLSSCRMEVFTADHAGEDRHICAVALGTFAAIPPQDDRAQ